MDGRNGLLKLEHARPVETAAVLLSMTAPARKTAGQRLALQTRHSVRQGHHATRNTYFACLHDDSRQDAVLLKDVGRAPIRGRSAALKAGGDGRSCGRCSPSTIRPSRAGRSKLRWLCGHCNFEALGGSPCVFFLVPNGLLTATRARSRPHRMGEQFCIELGGPVAKHSCCTRTARMASPAQATGRCACRSPASAPPRPGAIPPGEVENAREHLLHPARKVETWARELRQQRARMVTFSKPSIPNIGGQASVRRHARRNPGHPQGVDRAVARSQLLSQMRSSLPLSAERVMASNVRTLASISAMLTG